MRKYQVVTLPPNARLELMKMKLPEAPPELLQDTVPPNGNVKAPARDETEATDDAATTDAPVVDRSRSNDTLIIPRVQQERQQRLRTIVIAALCAGVVLVAVGFVVARGGASQPAESGSGDVQVLPVNTAAEGDTSPPAPAVPPSTEPAPATAATTRAAEEQPPRSRVESGRKSMAAAARPGGTTPSTPEASKSAAQPPKPAPASSARGKQPWIDGL